MLKNLSRGRNLSKILNSSQVKKSNNLKQGIFLRPERKRDKLHRREARDKITRGRSKSAAAALQ